MNEVERYEMLLEVRLLLDEYFDEIRGEITKDEWPDKCYEISDAISKIDYLIEEKI